MMCHIGVSLDIRYIIMEQTPERRDSIFISTCNYSSTCFSAFKDEVRLYHRSISAHRFLAFIYFESLNFVEPHSIGWRIYSYFVCYLICISIVEQFSAYTFAMMVGIYKNRDMCTVELSPDNTDKLIVIKSSANSGSFSFLLWTF